MSLSITLNKRVTLQQLTTTQDAAGQPGADGWVNVIAEGDGKIWAGIRDISGRDFVAAGGAQNSVSTVITIRFRSGVRAAMRVLYGDDIYKIEAVLGADNRRLQLACSRGAP